MPILLVMTLTVVTMIAYAIYSATLGYIDINQQAALSLMPDFSDTVPVTSAVFNFHFWKTMSFIWSVGAIISVILYLVAKVLDHRQAKEDRDNEISETLSEFNAKLEAEKVGRGRRAPSAQRARRQVGISHARNTDESSWNNTLSVTWLTQSSSSYGHHSSGDSHSSGHNSYSDSGSSFSDSGGSSSCD